MRESIQPLSGNSAGVSDSRRYRHIFTSHLQNILRFSQVYYDIV